MTGFSVTKISIAFECPRLFYLGHTQGTKMMFYPPKSAQGVGSAFHDLSEKMIHLFKEEKQFISLFNAPKLDPKNLNQEIHKRLYTLLFLPHINAIKDNSPNKISTLPILWQGLKALIDRLTEILIINREYCSSETLIQKTLITQEYKLAHLFKLPNGNQQLVQGKLDSLIFNFKENRLVVIEYKTYHPADPIPHLAQIALYSYMLSNQQNLPVNALVYCILPEFREYYYSSETLREKVYQLIPHKLQQMQAWLNWEKGQPSPPPPTSQPTLCNHCSQKAQCQQFFQEDKIIHNS